MKPEYTKVETKQVKHVFTDAEKLDLGARLACCHNDLSSFEEELSSLKKSHAAKVGIVESQAASLVHNITTGYEYRSEVCWVKFRTADKKKDFFLEGDNEGKTVVLTEDMTPSDFQTDLLLSEARFEDRDEISLFDDVSGTGDFGRLIVGRIEKNWFSSLRIKVGDLKVDERLDSEQRSFKQRSVALTKGVKRAKVWFETNLPQEVANDYTFALESILLTPEAMAADVAGDTEVLAVDSSDITEQMNGGAK